jgi:hypothetical protein
VESPARASSLGPSDSASQQTKLGIPLTVLLEMLEPPIKRPSFLPKSVPWDYEDCNDQTEDIIVTELNTRRLKMSLAIRRGDGTKISSQAFDARRKLSLHDSSISSIRIHDVLGSLAICGPSRTSRKSSMPSF